MATIQKRTRKEGVTYRAMVRIKGMPDQQRTFSRLTDARLWAQQTEAAIRRGEFQNVIGIARRKTLSEVIAHYRAEVLPRKSEGSQKVERTILAFWEGRLGAYALSYIDAEAITKHLTDLRTQGWSRKIKDDTEATPKPRSDRTIKYYRDTLALLFKYARQWGWTTANPLDGVSKVTKIRNGRVRYLSDDEREALLKACKASENPQLYVIVVFALSTGARRGEILGLTLADLDLSRDMAIFRDTKNGDTRSVPIVGHLKTILEHHAARTKAFYSLMQPPAQQQQQWLFPRSDGLEPIDIRKTWQTAREAAGLADFRFHDLRHSTASYLAMNGASLLEIADILGHKTLQMVQRYAHLSASHKKGVISRLNDTLFASI